MLRVLAIILALWAGTAHAQSVLRCAQEPGLLCLAGRAGSTNDPTLSTTADGTLTGSAAANNDLILKSAGGVQADQGFIETFGRMKLMTGHNSYGLGPVNRALDWDIGGTYDNSGANLCAFNIDGDITFNANPTGSDAVLFRIAHRQVFTNPAHTQSLLQAVLSNQTKIITDGAGVNLGNTNLGGFAQQTERNATNGSAISGGSDVLCSSQPTINGPVTGILYRGMHLLIPGGVTGAAGIGSFIGYEAEDFTPTGTPNLSYLSRGTSPTGHGFIHGGWMRVGSVPASLAVAGGSPTLHVDGTIRMGADPPSGLAGQLQFREPLASGANQQTFESPALAADVAYILPNAAPTSDGQVLASTTAGVMSWANNAGGGGPLVDQETSSTDCAYDPVAAGDDWNIYNIAASTTGGKKAVITVTVADDDTTATAETVTWRLYRATTTCPTACTNATPTGTELDAALSEGNLTAGVANATDIKTFTWVDPSTTATTTNYCLTATNNTNGNARSMIDIRTLVVEYQ